MCKFIQMSLSLFDNIIQKDSKREMIKIYFSSSSMQRLSVVLHTAVAWQTVNELACGDSGIVHGAKCIAVLNGVA